MKKIIKVCFLSFFGYSLFNTTRNLPFGGAEVQLYLLSKQLSKNRRFEISFLIGNEPLKKEVEFYGNIRLYGILPLKTSVFNYASAFFNTFKLLKIINPDILIQRTSSLITGICAFYCKIFKKKFIYSISHEMDANGRNFKGFRGKVFRYGVNNAYCIVAQNQNQIELLKKNKLFKNNNVKLIKIGHMFDEKIPHNSKKFILWVGRAIHWKRPEIFLNLVEKFQNEKFVMVCLKNQFIRDWNYWETLQIKASNYSNLRCIRYIPFIKIDDYFNQAKIFVNTSVNEGFPNTFIQALKNYTPILSLNVDPDDFLIKNYCGFNCKNDLDKFKRCFKILLSDKKLYQKLSLNGFNYVKKNHRIEDITKEWEILIITLCSIK